MAELGQVAMVEAHATFEEAGAMAQREAQNTMGICIPVVIYQQGNRWNATGAIPFYMVDRMFIANSASKQSSIGDVTEKSNRPVIPEHAETIAKYIADNRTKYTLPP